MANIEQNICDAIEVIANNLISKADFDKTVQATVLSCENDALGKYRVRYQDSTMYAYSSSPDIKYNKDNRVYVLIPKGDMAGDKTILGLVGKLDASISPNGDLPADPFNPDENDFEYTSDNLIRIQPNSIGIFSGTAYNQPEDEPIYYGKKINLSLKSLNKYVKKSKYFYVKARFTTDLEFKTEIGQKSNFGLLFTCSCTDGQDRTFSLDVSNGIRGNVTSLFNEDKHYMFLIPDHFLTIKKIELFAQNFPAQNPGIDESLVTVYDITVSNLELRTANSFAEILAGGNGIILRYPKGSVITNETESSLQAQAIVYENNKPLTANSNNFYWFKEDNSITDQVSSLGGVGWRCLNESNGINSWKPASDTFNFDKNLYLLAKTNNFKVKSYRKSLDGNSSIIHEREFTLENEYSKISAELCAYIIEDGIEKETDFPQNRGVKNLKIACKVDGDSIRYEYDWKVTFGNSERAFFNQDIKDKRIFGKTVEIENNYITGIDLSTISTEYSYFTITCTVRSIVGNLLVASTKEIVTLNNIDRGAYTLQLIDGDASFLYDTYGKPAIIVEEDRVLKFILIKNATGETIDIKKEISAGRMDIEWVYADDMSLLTNIQYYGTGIEVNHSGKVVYPEISYQLKSDNSLDYYNEKENNQIKLIVKYDNGIYEKSTNFTFLTMGDSGTNGTRYNAVISPDTGSIEKPYWAVFTEDDNDSGYFNFGNIDEGIINYTLTGDVNSTSGKFPFKVVLSDGNKIVYDSATGARPEEIKEVEWFMSTYRYTSAIEDKSNFKIEEGRMLYKSKLYADNDTTVRGIYGSNLDKELVAANVLGCKITYIPTIKTADGIENSDYQISKEISIFAYLPIVKIINLNDAYLDFDIESGYKEVKYDRDGATPHYVKSKNVFRITGVPEDKTLASWYTVGINGVKEGNLLVSSPNLQISENGQNEADSSQITIDPTYKFMGDSRTNAIIFCYGDSYIHIPIDMHLDRYGIQTLNDWDGNSININEKGGCIYAPLIGAGRKEQDNSFTGVLMGEVKQDYEAKAESGLYGYYCGLQSFGLHSETGITEMGFKGRSQIVIDPGSGKIDPNTKEFIGSTNAYIYGGGIFSAAAYDNNKLPRPNPNYLNNLFISQKDKPEKVNEYYSNILNKQGMLIDLTEGRIFYGSGNFFVDKYGNMTSTGAHLWNGEYESHPKKDENGNFIWDSDGHLVIEYTDIEDSYIDLNNNKNYDSFLKCQNKFKILKDGGRVVSSGGHFQNSDNSVFIDLENIDNDIKSAFNWIDEDGNLRTEEYVIYKNDNEDCIINTDYYPETISGFMLLCSKRSQSTDSNSKVYSDDIKTGITKDGTLITRRGKIGGFYINDDFISSSTLLGNHGYSDISFSLDGFYLERQDYHYDSSTGEIKEITKSIPGVMLAIGNGFIVTKNGDLYVNGFKTSSLTVDDITVYNNAYIGNEIQVKKENLHSQVIIRNNEIVIDDFSFREKTWTTTNETPSEFGINGEVFFGAPGGSFDFNSSPNLPWMTFSEDNGVNAITELPTGHIHLIYEAIENSSNTEVAPHVPGDATPDVFSTADQLSP